MGTNTIRRSQKPLKVKQNMTKRECIPCNKSRCLSCQQTIATTTFYLLTKMSAFQYSVCWKVDNCRKDIKNPNAIEACKHFDNWHHVFLKLMLIEQLSNIKNKSTDFIAKTERYR